MTSAENDPPQIRRKPVANPNVPGGPPGKENDQPPPYAPYEPPPPPPLPARPPEPPVSNPEGIARPPDDQQTGAGAEGPSKSQKAGEAFHKAYGETRHFLGGLIAHPTESNRHFTVLRHSHGIVFYRGGTNSVAISIFSDAPLPPDRTIWLQNKGWTGKTGMKTKALLRMNDDWLDVTPNMPVAAEQVNPGDERAWQRDIAKFRKKASGRARDHQLRETDVVRIPVEAGDGYFQLVVCRGDKKKKLCDSPVFRIVSTSLAPSSMRGASLRTMPLEVGAMVAGLYAQTGREMLTSPVTSQLSAYAPSATTQFAAETAYGAVGDQVGAALAGPDPQSYGEHSFDIEQGPVEPYPVSFKSRGEIKPDSSGDDVPMVNLTKVPDWALEQFNGYYFGWARYDMSNEKDTQKSAWQPAILTVKNLDLSQVDRVSMSHTMKRSAVLRFLDEVQLPGPTKVEVRAMGFLRPPPPASPDHINPETRDAAAEAAIIADACDSSSAQDVLAHPAWSPDIPSQAEKQWESSTKKEKTRAGFSNAVDRSQRAVEQVPLHWIGVRAPTQEMKDQRVAMSGFYIIRR